MLTGTEFPLSQHRAISAAVAHRADPNSLLKRTCSSFSLITAFPSPAFCAITHPSLAVTPGLAFPFSNLSNSLQLQQVLNFTCWVHFLILSWAEWAHGGVKGRMSSGECGQEHGRRWELLASCCSINHPLDSLRSFMQVFPVSLRLEYLDFKITQKNAV